MKNLFAKVALITMISLWDTSAWAAQVGRVVTQGAKVYQKPTTSSRVLGRLKKGTAVATSDSTRSGFYRMKTRSGLLGWIAEGDVQIVRKGGGAKAKTSSSSSSASGGKGLTVQLMGNLNLFKLTDFNDAVNMSGSGISNGVGFGLEVMYPVLMPHLQVGLRVESISKSIILKLTDEGLPEETFNIDASTLPVMIGASYQLMTPSEQGGSEGLGIGAGIFVGLALGTQVETVFEGADAPNSVIYKQSPLTVLPRVDLRYQMSNGFAFVGELGYRILSAPAAAPIESGNISGLYGTTPIDMGMNFSGLVLGLGASYTF